MYNIKTFEELDEYYNKIVPNNVIYNIHNNINQELIIDKMMYLSKDGQSTWGEYWELEERPRVLESILYLLDI